MAGLEAPLKEITDGDYRKILDDSLQVFFKGFVRAALTNPSQALYFQSSAKEIEGR